MSFSFEARGNPRHAVVEVGQQAAVQKVPQEFADAINNQLSALPEDATVNLRAHGHTGRGEAETRGTISMNVTIEWLAAASPKAKAVEAEEGDAA